MLTAPHSGFPDPVVLSTMTEALTGMGLSQGLSGGSAVFPTANTAYFYPVRLSRARTYTKAWWLNGATAAGNVDVGIYTIAGTAATRIVASTAVAQAGTSAMQVATTFTTTTIDAGIYWIAISCSLGTATFWRTAISATQMKQVPCFSAATSHPLTASPTVVAIASSFVPIFGFAELTSI